MPTDLKKPSGFAEDPEVRRYVSSSAARAAHHMGLPHGAAEDIYQTVMLSLLRMPHERIEEIANLNAYISEMARNEANLLRKKYPHLENIDSSSDLYSDGFAGAKHVEHSVLLHEIWTHLNPEEKDVLQLLIFGCDAKEIATRLEITHGSARQRISRLRKRLRHLVFDSIE